MSKKIAAIRIRGSVGTNEKVENTLKTLNLYRKNYCVVMEATPSMVGMIKNIKDYATWGEIDEKTYKLLIEKRGEEYKGKETDKKNKIKYKKFVVYDNKKYKPFFRLMPPRKGFGRKGIKVDFKIGGALGDRKEKINDLIERMI